MCNVLRLAQVQQILRGVGTLNKKFENDIHDRGTNEMAFLVKITLDGIRKDLQATLSAELKGPPRRLPYKQRPGGHPICAQPG